MNPDDTHETGEKRQRVNAGDVLSSIVGFLSGDTKWLELVSMALMLVWVAMLTAPLGVFASAHMYSVLDWVGETPIAILAAGISVTGAVGLFRRKRVARRINLMMGQLFWSAMGLAFLIADTSSSGGWVYTALSMLCGLGYVLGEQE